MRLAENININAKPAVKRRTGFLKELSEHKFLILLLLPGLLFFVVFSYLPMIGLVIAFQDFNPIKGIFASKFIGFKNFEFFFASSDWIQVTFNTIFLNAMFIVMGLICSIAIAIMLSEVGSKVFKKVTQSVVILPHFMSWSVVAMFSVAFFSSDTGLINSMLSALHLQTIRFYQQPEVWPGLLVMLRIWQGAGFGSIVYLAAIAGIDSEIYEAAKIDGANRLMSIFYITLPLLKNTAVLLFIMSVGKIFYGDFGMIYALVGNNTTLYPTTDVIDTYVYRSLMQLGDMGMASAVGLYQSAIGFGLVLASNALAKKYSSESAIF